MTKGKQGPACRLCGRPGLAAWFVIGRDRYFRCRDCRLIQMYPLPDVGVGDDYTGFDLERYRRFAGLFLVPQFRRAVALIRERKGSGRLLDIGCGTGEFLDEAERAGFAVTGLDPSATACRIAGRRHQVIFGRLEEAVIPAAAYDVVTLWSVLEHVPRPLPFLEKIRAAAKEDAILAIRVPAADGLLPRLARGLYRVSIGRLDRPLRLIYQLDWHYKHYYGYDSQNISRLLLKAGYEPLRIHRESSYDIPSLDERMNYLPRGPLARTVVKAAMAVILELSRRFRRQDEMVIIARRTGTAGGADG